MLSRPDRVALILRIADRYPEFSHSRFIFVLDSLGFTTDIHGHDIEDMIGTGTDEQVCELAVALGVDLPPGAAVSAAETTATTTVTVAEPLFIFGSHLSKHKAFVGEVGRELAAYGIELFVAHDTIVEDSAWEDEIRRALDRAHAGLAFVHEGLRESPWCDQEIGWLQGRHVPVMSLAFDAAPYGFFGRHQAHRVAPGTDAKSVAAKTIERITARPELALGFASSLISSLTTTRNFDETKDRWRYVRDLDYLDARLCARLLEAAKTHNQIYWASSPWDDHQNISRLIIDLVRQQPGGPTIAADIDAYEKYLDARDASGVSFYTLHDPPPATVTA